MLWKHITLTSSRGSIYLWTNGETTTNIEVSTNSIETYVVKEKDGSITEEDCVTVTVNTVKVNAGDDVTINEGESIKLTASGGDTYLWGTGETSKSIIVSPGVTETYEVLVRKGGCEDTDEVKVFLSETKISDPPPANAFAGDDISICLGESITLTGSGGDAYSWSTGSPRKDIEVNPTRTTTYSLNAIREGITTTDSIVVTVKIVIYHLILEMI